MILYSNFIYFIYLVYFSVSFDWLNWPEFIKLHKKFIFLGVYYSQKNFFCDMRRFSSAVSDSFRMLLTTKTLNTKRNITIYESTFFEIKKKNEKKIINQQSITINENTMVD